MTQAERDRDRHLICRFVMTHLSSMQLPPDSRIAAYEPLPSEPGSRELLETLTAAGFQVIVPITLPDRDLDWRRWSPLPAAPSTLDQSLGVQAVAAAPVILVPALAVDRRGSRLGRGGGSYDRSLARADSEAEVAALLFAGELIHRVPTELWDLPVTAAVTPTGWHPLTPSGRGNSG
jgi:5-formyltetrahydrofolate cyclo-ligase